jgi:catechol 2,3-dioxygenase
MSALDRLQGPVEPLARAPRPIDPRVTIGHVHLRTADIDRVRAFYVGILGFDVIAEARDVPGWGTTGDLLFLSAGGYHHHLGFNTWKSAGGGPTPDGVAGLHHVAFNYPTRAALADAVARLRAADWPLRQPPTTAPTWRSTSRIPTATTSSSCGTAHRRHGRATSTAT